MTLAGGGSLRALVLAAGHGERLRPLTELTPKPLLPVLGVPIIRWTLDCLAAAGVEATVVNLHHLGGQISERLGSVVDRMRVEYAPEQELLGTLGPLAASAGFLAASDPFLLVNGDSLCRWPIRRMLAAHGESGAEATLLLASRPDPEEFGGGVVVDGDGRVVSFRGGEGGEGTRRGVFTGFHVVAARRLRGLTAVPSDIVRDLYEPLVARGADVRGVFTRRRWHDLGTPRRYLDGVVAEARWSLSAGRVGMSWRGAGARVASKAKVRSSVIEADARVAPRARVSGSLLMAAARVGRGAVVEDSILGPGVSLAAGSRIAGKLVTRRLVGVGPRPGDSVVGDLVYSPL